MTIVIIIDNSNKDNPETCDIWDTDNNSDNWEPEIMTIFVIWQSIVTLESVRNSCDVFFDNVSQNQLATAVEYDDQWRGPLTTFAKFLKLWQSPDKESLDKKAALHFMFVDFQQRTDHVPDYCLF